MYSETEQECIPHIDCLDCDEILPVDDDNWSRVYRDSLKPYYKLKRVKRSKRVKRFFCGCAHLHSKMDFPLLGCYHCADCGKIVRYRI